MQAITLWLVCTVSVVGLVTAALGLFSTLTGRDPLPQSVRRRLRRTPASPEDFRMHGVGLILNGAAMELIAAYVVINVVVRLALFPAGLIAYSQDSALEFPNATVFLVSTVTVVVAVALFIAARFVTARVHYESTRPAPGSQTGTPPA